MIQLKISLVVKPLFIAHVLELWMSKDFQKKDFSAKREKRVCRCEGAFLKWLLLTSWRATIVENRGRGGEEERMRGDLKNRPGGREVVEEGKGK